MKLLALCTTVGRPDDAQRIATAAVERRLAACVHIDAIESVYRWRGAVQRDTEQRLMFKTTEAAAPALRALILEMHPYELPALYALELADASAAYRDWVMAEVQADVHAAADPGMVPCPDRIAVTDGVPAASSGLPPPARLES